MINVEGGIDDAEMHFCAIINEPVRSIGVVLIGGSRILREDLLKSGLVAGAEQTKFSIRCLPNDFKAMAEWCLCKTINGFRVGIGIAEIRLDIINWGAV